MRMSMMLLAAFFLAAHGNVDEANHEEANTPGRLQFRPEHSTKPLDRRNRGSSDNVRKNWSKMYNEIMAVDDGGTSNFKKETLGYDSDEMQSSPRRVTSGAVDGQNLDELYSLHGEELQPITSDSEHKSVISPRSHTNTSPGDQLKANISSSDESHTNISPGDQSKTNISPSVDQRAKVGDLEDLKTKESYDELDDKGDLPVDDDTVNISYKRRYISQLDNFEESDPSVLGIKNICKYTDNFETEPVDKPDCPGDRDMFNCSSKCLCQYLGRASSPEQHVSANCGHRHLHLIPPDLPNATMRLDVSYNILPTLDLANVFRYKALQKLSATDCGIRAIANATAGSSNAMVILNLEYNNIKSLSDGVFAGFPKLRFLYLTGNMIQRLQHDLFTGLSKLSLLDMSINNILTIDNRTFENLTELKVLSLSGNSHLGYEVLTVDLLKSLRHLTILKIQGSSNGAKEYPNEAIGVLENLEDLNIDALAHPAQFGSQFTKLKHLKILSFGPYADCRLINMPDSFFQHFSQLRCLYFNACNISYINPRAYDSLRNLKALTVNSVPSMTLDKAFEDLQGFKSKSLEYIGFNNLTNWYWPCIWLNDTQGEPMIGFNLTTINLSNNRLSLLTDGFIDNIPKTVEKLILRGNKFTLMNPFWTSLSTLPNLSYIDVSYQNMVKQHYYVPLYFEGYHYHRAPTNELREIALPRHPTVHSLMKHSASQGKQATVDSGNRHTLNIPAKLQVVVASWYNFFGDILLSNDIGPNNLTSLNFSRSGLSKWGRGKLPKEVEYLDVSINAAICIDHDFFHPNNSLIQLHLQVNFLGDFIGGANGSVFRDLKHLRYLDLSTNVIFGIPFDFFNGLSAVETIILTDNRLETLNVSFEMTPHLNFLDLHKNSLSWISETTRKQMDKLTQQPCGFVIDLHYNSFQCTCDTISMLQWMAESDVYFLNIHLYTCHDSDNQMIGITSKDEIRHRVAYLRRHCFSYGYLMFGITSFCVIFVIVTTTGIAYRKRWWIRYKKHALFAKWFGFKPSNAVGNSDELRYKYDAFLLYVSNDRRFANTCQNELEKNRHHRLCIGDRNILPGTNEIEAIVSAVQNSRVTVVVITEEFVRDMNNQFRENPMLDYALQMALMEEYCTKRQTLHVILCIACDDVKYPPYILKVFRDDCLTRFPTANDANINVDIVGSCWDSLSSAIGHSVCRNDANDDVDDYSFCYHPYVSEEGSGSIQR